MGRRVVTEPSDGVAGLKRRRLTVGSLIALTALCIAIGAAALAAHGRMRDASVDVVHEHQERLLEVAHPPAARQLDDLTRELRVQREKLEGISIDVAGIRQAVQQLANRRR